MSPPVFYSLSLLAADSLTITPKRDKFVSAKNSNPLIFTHRGAIIEVTYDLPNRSTDMKLNSRPYNTVIPIKLPIEKLDTWGEAYAELAKQTGSELFIIIRNVFGDRERFLKELGELRAKVRFFGERGITVGAWLCPTTGHEGMGLLVGDEGKKFTHREVAD